MFYVIVEYPISGTEIELGPFDSYEDALEVANDAIDEPGADYYVYKNDILY